MTKLQVKRGLNAGRTFIPLSGELLWTTDTKKLYVGDGTTSGGIAVDTNLLTSFNGRSGAILPIVGDYASFYVSLTGSYSNPTWITSLDPAKITQTANYRFVTDTEKTTWNGKQAGSSVLTSIATLSTGTGLVKLTNGTASLDTSTYATTTQLGAYLPIANPTFTGTLTGPTATFTGQVKTGSVFVADQAQGGDVAGQGARLALIDSAAGTNVGWLVQKGSTNDKLQFLHQNSGSWVEYASLTRTGDLAISGKGKFGAEASIETFAGGSWSWYGHSGLNNGTTWSGFMQNNSGDVLVGALIGSHVTIAVGQVNKLDVYNNLVSIATSLAVNGAAMPTWGTGLNPIMLGGESFLYSYKSVAGTQPTWGSNFYYDGTNLKTIATYTNSNYPRALLIDTAGTLNYLASNVSPTAGATITDLNSKFSVDRSGNGTFAGSLTVSTSVTTPVVYSPSSLSIGGASSLIALSMAGENTCSINLLSTKYVQFNHPDYSNGSTSTDWFLRYTGDTGSANAGKTYLGAKNALYLQNQNHSSLRVDTDGGSLLGAWATSYETKNVTSTVSLTLLMTIVTASAVTITIPNGTYGGQLKIIKNASANTITISATGLGVTSHLSGVSTIYIWNGSNWS